MASSSLYLAFFLVPILLRCSNAGPVRDVPAVIVFGDSIVDPGNNNGLKTLTKCNFPPYGRDFAGQRATGRFSNGKIPTDFIASQLGIKEYLPAYLDPELSDEELLTGVSFASGGAGFDNITAHIVSVFTLWDQLEMFKEYKRKIESIAGAERAARIVNESVYIIFAGSNDLMVTYFTTNLRSYYDQNSYIDYVTQAASSFLKNLYDLGARKIGLLGLPPLGCEPMVRTIKGGIMRECVETYNQASAVNQQLLTQLNRLTRELPGSQIVYLDVYNFLLNLIMNPSNYGFEEAAKGCCGTGNVEATVLCTEMDYPLTCRDTSKFLFWDSFHPTERAYELLVTQLVQNYMPLLI